MMSLLMKVSLKQQIQKLLQNNPPPQKVLVMQFFHAQHVLQLFALTAKGAFKVYFLDQFAPCGWLFI